jgi:hypothetical protein
MEAKVKKMTAKAQSYKAGAKAFSLDGVKAKNPHPTHAEGSKSWEHGYLDSQKLRANRDGDAFRKRAILHLAQI